MKKFLSDNWEILVVIALALATAWPIFMPGYFSHHDDLQVIRIFEMRKCFADGQIPCRWVPDMGYGNGFPLFNYYSATPYYLGAFLSYILGYIGSAKVLFFIPILVGGLGMYLLAKELFGKTPGLVPAALYIFLPYRALDTYVRGAVAESFALAIVPFIFYFVLKLAKSPSLWNFLGLTLSLFTLLTSHNIMSIFFIPILMIWAGYWLIINKFNNFKQVILAFILAFGLSAFFIIPAYFEKDLVQVDTLTISHLDYRVHFVAIKQLLERFWSYGASVQGSNDGISFQIGWPHVVLVTSAILFLRNPIAIFLFVIFAVSVFMTHNKSAFIWEAVPILKYVQFPWRFLAVVGFSASLIGGFFAKKKALAALIIIITVLLNFSYFKPEKFYPNLTDSDKLTGELWEKQERGGILDYLPKTASEPKVPAENLPIVRFGEAEVMNFVNKSNAWEFKAKVKTDSLIEVPVFDFPDWQIKVGEQVYPHKTGIIGRITLDISPGEYSIKGKLNNTPIRTYANLVTVFSFISLVGLSVYGKNSKLFG